MSFDYHIAVPSGILTLIVGIVKTIQHACYNRNLWPWLSTRTGIYITSRTVIKYRLVSGGIPTEYQFMTEKGTQWHNNTHLIHRQCMRLVYPMFSIYSEINQSMVDISDIYPDPYRPKRQPTGYRGRSWEMSQPGMQIENGSLIFCSSSQQQQQQQHPR